MKFPNILTVPLILAGMVLTGSATLFGNGQATLSSGEAHTLIIGENNTLWAWGGNAAGQLGDGSAVDSLIPVRITETNDWQYVAAGVDHSLAIKTDGTLWAWGANNRGQLGTGGTDSSNAPVRVGTRSDWTHIAAGREFSVGIRNNGMVYVWGAGESGQLARNPAPLINNPLPLASLLVPTLADADNTYTAIAAGGAHVLAIRTGGALYAWGNNGVGQLGLGPTTGLFIFNITRVGGASNWQFVEASTLTSFAINSSNALFAWGSNGIIRQLGVSSCELCTEPTRVGTAANWAQVAAGEVHTLALKTDGTLWGFGNNSAGQLGIPIFDESNNLIIENLTIESPTRIGAASDWQNISAGNDFSAAQKTDGVVFTAGVNDKGQLGNGTTAEVNTGFEGSFFGVPDLAIADIDIATDNPGPGDSINLNIFVANLGTASIPAGSGIQLEVRLSDDAVFDIGDTVLPQTGGGALVVDDAIGSSLSVNVPVSVDLPASIDAGEFFIVARVDITDEIEENLEDNNDGSSQEALDFRADLVVAIDEADFGDPLPGVFAGGDALNFDITIRNTGTGNIPAGAANGFEVQVFLSEDNFPGTGDILLEEEGTFLFENGIDVGTPIDFTVQSVIPRALPVGKYFVITVVDALDNVPEFVDPFVDGEGNNTTPTSQTVIDLQGITLEEALDNPVFVPITGSPVTLSFTSSGDAFWFGQDDIVAPEEISFAGNDDAIESPPLQVGEKAVISAVIPGPSRITFRWSANTSSINNALVFTISGTEPDEGGRISGGSGEVEFEEVSFILPGESNTVSWTYQQNVEGDGTEAVYLDFVEVEPLDGFDIFVDNVEFEPGTYVPQLDNLDVTVLARNQGLNLTEADIADLVITATLSLDRVLGNADDVLLGELIREPDPIGPDERFGYFATRPIPDFVPVLDEFGDPVLDENEEPITRIIPAGNYHLIVFLDSNDDLAESDETNNIFVSDSASITIEPRPDIRPLSFNVIKDFPPPPDQAEDPEPALILLGDRMELEFTLRNQGLAETTSANPFRISVVLSRDSDLTDGGDFTLFSVEEPNGLPLGEVKTYGFDVEVPDDTPTGEFFFVGLIVDSTNDLTESNESNNTLLREEPDLMFSKFTVAEAVSPPEAEEITSLQINEQDINNDLNLGANATADAPWFGQSNVVFNGMAAAQSADIGDGELSAFEYVIREPDFADSSVILSFAWRVRSERAFVAISETQEVLKFDALSFFVNNEFKKLISGTDNDWLLESFEVPLDGDGQAVVRWEYEKDGTVSVGSHPDGDAGWVANIRTVTPNLSFPDEGAITVLTGPPYNSGTQIDITTTFENSGGSEIRSNVSFDVEVRLVQLPRGADSNTFVLGRQTITGGMAEGESRTLTFNGLTIPLNLAVSGEYELEVELDTGDAVVESIETDNISFPGAQGAPLDIATAIDLDTALDFAAPRGWVTRGASTWFGQNNEFLEQDGSTSAAQSSPIAAGEQVTLETTFDKDDPNFAPPALVSFYWKVSSIAGANTLKFLISDQEAARISGDVDWEQRTFFIPAGTQKIGWTYTKTNNNQVPGILDTAWVDLVTFEEVTLPDLIIKTLEVTPGEYILDRGDDPDRDKLPVRVVAENRGAEIPDSFNFVASDITIVLSLDRIFGDEDDRILGDFGTAPTVDPSGQIIFEGEINLPLDLPEGNYFVAAYIDALGAPGGNPGRLEEWQEVEDPDFVEYTSTDNNLAFTLQNTVVIRRLPDLVVENVAIEGIDIAGDIDKIFYPEDIIRVSFDIRNRGLGTVPGNQSFFQTIKLFAEIPGLLNEGSNGEAIVHDTVGVDDILDTADEIVDAEGNPLAQFSTTRLLEGVNEFNPNGSVLHFEAELVIHTEQQIRDSLASSGDIDIELFEYFLVFEVDNFNGVDESDEQNIFIPLVQFPILSVPAGGDTFSAWQARYESANENAPTLTGIDADDDGDGLSNLLEYALGTNPFVNESSAAALLETPGFTRVDGEDFLSMAFDFNIFAGDILLKVEVSDGGGPFSPILTLEPPYLDETGPQSLTGQNGLLSDPQVISVTPRGYTARTNVIDVIPASQAEMRMMRLIVEED